MPPAAQPRSFALRPGQADNCLRRLLEHYQAHIEPIDETVHYFDSFDWRLYDSETTLVLLCRGGGRSSKPLVVTWETLAGVPRRRLPTLEVPAFSWDLPPGPARHELEPILGVRRLLPLVAVRRRGSLMHIVNDDGKIVLRLRRLERRVIGDSSLSEQLRIEPLKGYENRALEIEALLQTELDLAAQRPCELEEALAAIGRVAGDYASKVSIPLRLDMPAETALRAVHRGLLSVIRANEAGVLGDLDSEFLHDFRVAVRRTRSALSQIRGVYPRTAVRRFGDGFSWLGSLTGPQRDLDVYLLKLRGYRDELSEAERRDLRPLEELLCQRRKQEHDRLVRTLAGRRYASLLQAWEKHLDKPIAAHSSRPNAHRPILEVASRRTWKIYRRILTRGAAICDDSPDRDLHRLRIEAKKLRYLMELFRTLYAKEIDLQIKALKELQDLLGDFNDYSVHEAALRESAAELGDAATAHTHLVLGRLVEQFHRRRDELRAGFLEAFTHFASPHNQKACRDLFRHRRVEP